MDYRQGTTGRVFCIRFDDGDDFLGNLTDLIIKEQVRQGWFHVIGGLREAQVVTGPKAPTMPPDPVWTELATARETLGTGTVFWDGETPRIHLHAALGHHGDTLTGCVRKGTKVYLILEVVLIEIAGIEADRPWFAAGGFNRLSFSD
ncbi:MAG TPA: PPC domain-containing DNA-binding protein [Desulfurivibrionaceae bacterium]|nr:PPC domain-containing DNA-binding protein [Desulfurivibrionaceae bacterium]